MGQPNNKIAQASVKDHVALTAGDLSNINNPSNGSMAIILDTCDTYVYKDGWEIYVTAGGADGNDYVDSVSLEAGNILTLGRTGALADLTVDLSSLVDDTNLARIVSGALAGGTLTLTRDDASTFDIDLSSLVNQSDAQIKTQYEANADTNAFDDAAVTKLGGIEANATADQTDAEIRAAVDAATDSNVFTDADHSKLDGIEALAEVNVQSDWNSVSGDDLILNKPDLSLKADLVAGKVPASQLPSYVDDVLEVANFAALPGTGETGKLYVTLDDDKIFRWTGSTYVEVSADAGAPVSSVNTQTGAVVLDADDISDAATTNKFATTAELSKLGGIEALATADQTDAEIKTAYENNADTNNFDDAAQSKLGAIEASATADQTDAEIKTAYENNADTNAFTDSEQTIVSTAPVVIFTGGKVYFEFTNPAGAPAGTYRVEATI